MTSGQLNLSAINQLTCTGAAVFAGTLNVSGDTGAAILMTYSSDSGAFIAPPSGLPSGYALSYGATDLAVVSAGAPTWKNTADSNWNNGTNWSAGSVPASVPGASAVVGVPTTSQVTITLDIPQTLGSLTFTTSGEGGGYTLLDNTGTNSLTMSNSSNLSPAVINVTSGTHSIAASTMIAGGNLAVSASSNGLLTISGNILDDSNSGSIPANARSLTLTSADGTGELILSGTNSYAGGTFVESGTLVLTNNEALAAGSSLTIGDASAFAGGLTGAGSDTGSVSSGLSSPLADHEYMVPAPSITPVPEPGTLVLVAAGVVAGLATWRRRRSRGN
jgi:autotransporter-associated beta strand protein